MTPVKAHSGLVVSFLVTKAIQGLKGRMDDVRFRRCVLCLSLLGYLDSNQEQMKLFFVVSSTRNWGRMPRVSAVLMDVVYALVRTSTG